MRTPSLETGNVQSGTAGLFFGFLFQHLLRIYSVEGGLLCKKYVAVLLLIYTQMLICVSRIVRFFTALRDTVCCWIAGRPAGELMAESATCSNKYAILPFPVFMQNLTRVVFAESGDLDHRSPTDGVLRDLQPGLLSRPRAGTFAVSTSHGFRRCHLLKHGHLPVAPHRSTGSVLLHICTGKSTEARARVAPSQSRLF